MTASGHTTGMSPAICSSCDLSDACDALGIAAVRTGALGPLWPGCPPLIGALRPVRLEPAAGADSPLADLLAFLAEASGQVVLVDLGGRVDMQCWGTVLATAARRFGVLGALVNGAARDVDGLRALGLPCYARGVHPTAMRGRLRIASIDHAVQLDGQTIAAGSFAAVDSSGAVFLPAARAAEAQQLAGRRAQEERQHLQAIESGADPRTIFGGGGPAQP
jgi:4-hydroxy-4-methyl-2-oxoglutarate aldolase